MTITNMFDYLLVFEDLLLYPDMLANDYLNSTVEMSSENRRKGKNYRCCLVCVGYTREQRKNLSGRTGIPLSRIVSVEDVLGKKINAISELNQIMVNLMYGRDFIGRIKVYTSEQEIPREKFNSDVEVVYAE